MSSESRPYGDIEDYGSSPVYDDEADENGVEIVITTKDGKAYEFYCSEAMLWALIFDLMGELQGFSERSQRRSN